MKKSLAKIKITQAVIFIIELLLIVFTGICYFYDYLNIKEFINLEIIFITLSCFVIFDIIFIWITTLLFEKWRRNSDLKAADLIGHDVNEAYNFGMVGLVVVDNKQNVVWINDFLKERQIDILDSNIIEWRPTLKDLADGSSVSVSKILVNTRSYEVKYLKEAGLYILKDVTDLDTISDFANKQSTVVGQIIIDNYSDISDSGDETGDAMTKARSTILEYCKENGVLVRKVRNDAYFILCNYESLSKMENDRFSVLNEIREIGENSAVSPTISVGIAYNFPDVVKLNDMATSAIDIAMSRGGDQVVVSKYGEELVFYGGKTAATETRSKVKIRVMADSVLSLIKSSSNIIIMGHTMMDMDAIGACLGMKAMCDYCKKEALIVYEPKKTERKAKGAISTVFEKESGSFLVNENKALSELRNNTLVIVCDVHKAAMTMSPKVIEKANKIMIIDHHRRGEELIESPIFATIDPSASSTSELVAELVYYSSANPKITIPENYATIMLSGIFLDSNYFKTTTSGSKTFEASMILKEFGADNGLADEYLKDEFEEYALINKIISTLKTPYYGVVYCTSDNNDIIESATLAKVANQCMQMKGVNAAFIIGRVAQDDVRISCRSDSTINVQILAEKLNGGGHYSQAAGSFNKISVAQAESKLLDVLNDYLNDARTLERKE